MHLAYELRDTAIKVNAAHPGFVNTELHGVDAPMTPEEGAEISIALALLDDAGPHGSFYHGAEVLAPSLFDRAAPGLRLSYDELGCNPQARCSRSAIAMAVRSPGQRRTNSAACRARSAIMMANCRRSPRSRRCARC